MNTEIPSNLLLTHAPQTAKLRLSMAPRVDTLRRATSPGEGTLGNALVARLIFDN